jgi:thiopurine S-methyltransferase
MKITNTATQLLISYVYNQLLMDGPPFSVIENVVMQHYGSTYHLKSVDIKNVAAD